ncbi:MAG: outer-membrane lipoprotein carrier protein LolA, partial [Bacteroidota bacterium]
NAFICAPIIDGREEEQTVRWVELKPLDEDAEYFKLRLSVSAKQNQLLRIRAFSKDGSRYALHLDDLRPNRTYSNEHFTFDLKAYPDVHVEDLRID